MTNPFQPPPPPVRVRFESATAQRDVIVPAALVVFPDPTNTAMIEVVEQHQNHAQIVSLVVTVMRWAIMAGLMGDVMATLANTPMQSPGIVDHGPTPKPGIPPDDLPPHLRRKP